MLYFYCVNDTAVEGPVAIARLRKLYADGLLPAETKVCPEGSNDWCTLQALLRSVISAPPPPATPPPLPPTQRRSPVSPPRVSGKTSDDSPMLWVAAFVPAFSVTAAVVIPIVWYMETLEKTGRTTLPDSYMKPLAAVLFGLCIGLTHVFKGLMGSVKFTSKTVSSVHRSRARKFGPDSPKLTGKQEVTWFLAILAATALVLFLVYLTEG